MSRGQKLRILTYDISDDKIRRRVATILEDRATRVQFSVFEGRLSDRMLERVVSSIEEHIQLEDSLRVYTLSSTSEKSCKVVGGGIPMDTNASYWLF